MPTMKFLVSCLIFFTLYTSGTCALSMSLYYESLCPDSIRFISKQLTPSYDIVKNDLEIQFVPYGNAKTENDSGIFNFTCQHGPNECYGNKVQACVIDQNEDQDTQVKFISCAMSSGNASDTNILQNCADSVGLDWDPIEECLESGLADTLLAELGVMTNSVNPPIQWVPTLIFDGTYNTTLQYIGEHHFLILVCELLSEKPIGCP